MVSYLNSLLPSLNKPAPEKDKKKDAGQATGLEQQKNTVQSQPEQQEQQKDFVHMTDEEKQILDKLFKLEEESKNPPFVLSTEESKQKKKEMDDFYLANKKSNLKMLVRAAQLRSPQQYTAKSWQNLRRQMGEAMRIAGNPKASSAALTRALNHMRSGLTGLRYKMKKPEYKNFKRPLPMEKIAQKPKTVEDIFGKPKPTPLEELKNANNPSAAPEQQAAGAEQTGTNVDVSCSETNVATPTETAESIDVQA